MIHVLCPLLDPLLAAPSCIPTHFFVQVGYPSSTPVAIVEKASTPQQRTLVGTVDTIVEVSEREKAVAPAVIVVGEVVEVRLWGPFSTRTSCP